MTDCTEFWAIRHAPVIGVAGEVHPSDAAADLGDGERLRALAASLPVGAQCHCSPARRTRDTASALGLGCQEVPALREQDFGAWIGRRHDEIASRGEAEYAEFWREPAANVPPGGESFVAQICRTREALDAIGVGQAVLVVHSGTIRAMLAIALDIAPERALSFMVDPLSLTRIDRVGGGWRVVCVNRPA